MFVVGASVDFKDPTQDFDVVLEAEFVDRF